MPNLWSKPFYKLKQNNQNRCHEKRFQKISLLCRSLIISCINIQKIPNSQLNTNSWCTTTSNTTTATRCGKVNTYKFPTPLKT